jgi:16S rRNA (guanine527-N7)-methyltransferase
VSTDRPRGPAIVRRLEVVADRSDESARPIDRGPDGERSVDRGGAEAEPPTVHRAAAERLFADRLPLAIRYAELLVTDGVVRGLIGPHEAPRIWERHLLNCAAVAELIPDDARVIDVGSGAGLPGMVLAVARPDISVVLVEPLARRTAFLSEAVTLLGLDRITVVRGRAEELVPGRGHPGLAPADVVTARAVAPLDRLTAWCLPLAAEGGRMLALKGESAVEEVAAHAALIGRLGGGRPTVRRCGQGLIDPPAIVVEIARIRAATRSVSTDRSRGRSRNRTDR